MRRACCCGWEQRIELDRPATTRCHKSQHSKTVRMIATLTLSARWLCHDARRQNDVVIGEANPCTGRRDSCSPSTQNRDTMARRSARVLGRARHPRKRSRTPDAFLGQVRTPEVAADGGLTTLPGCGSQAHLAHVLSRSSGESVRAFRRRWGGCRWSLSAGSHVWRTAAPRTGPA